MVKARYNIVDELLLPWSRRVVLAPSSFHRLITVGYPYYKLAGHHNLNRDGRIYVRRIGL